MHDADSPQIRGLTVKEPGRVRREPQPKPSPLASPIPGEADPAHLRSINVELAERPASLARTARHVTVPASGFGAP